MCQYQGGSRPRDQMSFKEGEAAFKEIQRGKKWVANREHQ